MLEGNHFAIVVALRVVLVVVVVGLPGLPAFFKHSIMYVWDLSLTYTLTHTHAHILNQAQAQSQSQKHGKSFVMPAKKGMQGVGVLVCQHVNCIVGITSCSLCLQRLPRNSCQKNLRYGAA